MAFNLKGRNLLTLKDFTADEISYLIELSETLKKNKYAGIRARQLEGKSMALIFEKTSTRTRAAFTVACFDEGAHAEYLGVNDIQIGKKESVKDTARVLGRIFDGIAFRGFSQERVEELGRYAGVPVWNALTDDYHPTQILADFMTIKEIFGKLKGLKLAYLGDGRNNMAVSLMIGAAKMGMEIAIVTPGELFPPDRVVAEAREIARKSGGEITITSDIDTGVINADVLYTDIWASMGEEEQIPQRIELLKSYQVNMDVIKRTANEDVIFLHCLPSFHDENTDLVKQFPDIIEVTDEVFESSHSKVFQQAENRMHTIKAVMVATV